MTMVLSATGRRFSPGLCATVLAVCLMATAAMAQNFHAGNELHCSDCHIIHASRRGIGFGGSPLNPPGFRSLLRAATVNELCVTCHDGGNGAAAGAPDVAGSASYESSSIKRAAGSFAAAVGAVTNQGHDLGVGGQTATGGTWNSGEGLSCVHCHEPHGNANYRNLVLRPGNAGSDLAVTDVVQTVLTPTSTQYGINNIRYTGPNGLSRWCQGCHTNFHGAPGDPSMGGAITGDTPGGNTFWFRHPTAGVTMADGVSNEHVDPLLWFTNALSYVPVVSPTQSIPGAAVTSDNEPFCGSCHKAHGSTHRAAMIWDNPATVALEDGTTATQTCQSCHNM